MRAIGMSAADVLSVGYGAADLREAGAARRSGSKPSRRLGGRDGGRNRHLERLRFQAAGRLLGDRLEGGGRDRLGGRREAGRLLGGRFEGALLGDRFEAGSCCFSATDLKQARLLATDLKQAGFLATEGRRPASRFEAGGGDLKQAGFSAHSCRRPIGDRFEAFEAAGAKMKRREGAQADAS